MARPEDQDTALSSPLSQRTTFDSRKLGQLALARRALSMESEVTRSSVWNLYPEPGIRSLDSRSSTESLNLNSLRKLGASPNKRDARRPSDGTPDEGVTIASNAKATHEHSPGRRREVTLVNTNIDTLLSSGETASSERGYGQVPREAILEAGNVVTATFLRPRRPRTARASLCRGADDKALVAAVAELARRRSSEASSIVLPTNRPFLVGELASRIQQQTTPQSPTRTIPTCESINPSPLRTASTPHKEIGKEAPDITILSKLLFFGGTTPQKVFRSAQSTPEAVTPDVTVSPQSRSDSSDGFQHSYLLQLGQIMGGFAQEEPIHRTARESDETAHSTTSTISSLEHPVAEKREQPRRVRRSLRCFLFLMACVASSWITFQDGGCVFGTFDEAKVKLVPYARQRYNNAVRQVELFLETTGWTEVYTKMINWINGNIGREHVWVVTQKRHNFNLTTRHSSMVIALDSVNTTAPIIPPRAQSAPHIQWTLPSEISTTPIETNRGVASPNKAEIEEANLGRNLHNNSDENPVEQPTDETPTPDASNRESQEDGAMTNTTLDSSEDYSHGAQLASHSNSVPSKHHDNISCLVPAMQSSFWKSNRPGASFLSVESRHDNVKLLPCFFSDVIPNQCHPSASANLCCSSEFFATEKRATVPRINDALSFELEEDDGFLQIPLVDVVAQFLRERLKKRQKKRPRPY